MGKSKSVNTRYMKRLSGLVRECEWPRGPSWSEVVKEINFLEKCAKNDRNVEGYTTTAQDLHDMDAMRDLAIRIPLAGSATTRWRLIQALKKRIRHARQDKAALDMTSNTK